ncbi:hypothetical protein H8A97_24575 [Bradyrhizobium sp. Arg62]|uniref:hypothetical protein n=1 Tax=Bradyrhizobium brasilense TaxID=1419277 RepID=UPI001E5D2C25|nr:hypothetical protein [Bradyrhizobium brasilense]MCC8948197.1 hypothetical protein [Bradyrhizobium brasilense]
MSTLDPSLDLQGHLQIVEANRLGGPHAWMNTPGERTYARSRYALGVGAPGKGFIGHQREALAVVYYA